MVNCFYLLILVNYPYITYLVLYEFGPKPYEFGKSTSESGKVHIWFASSFSFALTRIFLLAMDKHPFETWDQLVHSMLHPAILLQSVPDAIDRYLVTAK